MRNDMKKVAQMIECELDNEILRAEQKHVAVPEDYHQDMLSFSRGLEQEEATVLVDIKNMKKYIIFFILCMVIIGGFSYEACYIYRYNLETRDMYISYKELYAHLEALLRGEEVELNTIENSYESYCNELNNWRKDYRTVFDRYIVPRNKNLTNITSWLDAHNYLNELQNIYFNAVESYENREIEMLKYYQLKTLDTELSNLFSDVCVFP